MKYLFNVSFLTEDGRYKSNIEHRYSGDTKKECIENMKDDLVRWYDAQRSTIRITYEAKK